MTRQENKQHLRRDSKLSPRPTTTVSLNDFEIRFPIAKLHFAPLDFGWRPSRQWWFMVEEKTSSYATCWRNVLRRLRPSHLWRPAVVEHLYIRDSMNNRCDRIQFPLHVSRHLRMKAMLLGASDEWTRVLDFIDPTRHADPRWFRWPFAGTAELSEGKYVRGGFLPSLIFWLTWYGALRGPHLLCYFLGHIWD